MHRRIIRDRGLVAEEASEIEEKRGKKNVRTRAKYDEYFGVFLHIFRNEKNLHNLFGMFGDSPNSANFFSCKSQNCCVNFDRAVILEVIYDPQTWTYFYEQTNDLRTHVIITEPPEPKRVERTR